MALIECLPSLLRVDLENTGIGEETKRGVFEEVKGRSRHAALY